MKFNPHYNLIGKHAFLSASKYHWLNYDIEKLRTVYYNELAAQEGTELHDLAASCIKHGVKLPRTQKTLNMYVNDGIGFMMTPEQPLYYSDNAFGTCDTISFDGKLLRIHDYKSGVTPAHLEQLEIYAALFCLEYNIDPLKIQIVLQIYQNDSIQHEEPQPEVIREIMKQIIRFDEEINKIKEGS